MYKEEDEDNEDKNMNTENPYEMRGGAVINTGYQNNSKQSLNETQWADALFEMIDNAKSIDCISYSSLKGFIFVIEMNEQSENYPFKSVALGDTGTQQKKGLSKILLKITLLSNEREEALPPFKDKYKMTDTANIFKDEVKVQQELFSSILTSTANKENGNLGMAYCPSILYDAVLKDNEKKAFLDLLKIKSNNAIHNEINYLTEINKPMGLVAMEYMDNYSTYYQYSIRKRGKVNCEQEDLIRFRVNIIATILILLLEKNIIHTDLHQNNVMVYNKDKYYGVNFIDFGRVLNLNDETLPNRPELKEKIGELKQKIGELKQKIGELTQINDYSTILYQHIQSRNKQFFEISKELNNNMKIKYDEITKIIIGVIHLINDVELLYLQITIRKNIQNAQSKWIHNGIFDNKFQPISITEKKLKPFNNFNGQYIDHIIRYIIQFYSIKIDPLDINTNAIQLYKTDNNLFSSSLLLSSYIKIMNQLNDKVSIIKEESGKYHFYYYNQMFQPLLQHIQTLATINDSTITQQSSYASLYIQELKIEDSTNYNESMHNTIIKTMIDICMVHGISFNDFDIIEPIKTILTPYIEKITQSDTESSTQSEFFKQMIELFKSNDNEKIMENLHEQLKDPFYKNLIDINGNTPFHFLILLFYLSKTDYNSDIDDDDLNKFKKAVTITTDDTVLYPVFDELIHVKNKYGLTPKCFIDFYIDPTESANATIDSPLNELTKCDIKPDIKEGSVISYEIKIENGKKTFNTTNSPNTQQCDILLKDNETSNKIIKVLNTVVTLDNNVILDYIKKMMKEYNQPFTIHFLYTVEQLSQIITINYIVIDLP